MSKVVFGYFVKPFNEHCWVETKTNIIDITASQFGDYDPVCIFNKCASNYVKKTVCRNIKYFEETKWGNEQRPNEKIVQQILKMS